MLHPWPSTSPAGTFRLSHARPTAVGEDGTMTHLHPSTSSRKLCSDSLPPANHCPQSPHQGSPLSPPGDGQLFEAEGQALPVCVCLCWASPGADAPLSPTVHSSPCLKRSRESFKTYYVNFLTGTTNLSNKQKQREWFDEAPRIHHPSSTGINLLSILFHLFISFIFAEDW